jgi:anti-anti-sigma factor
MTVMRLSGELDLYMVTAVRPRFPDLDGDVEVDCAGLTFMDAAGINLLLEMERLCDANGAKLTVVNPPRCVTRTRRPLESMKVTFDKLTWAGRALSNAAIASSS